MKTGPKPKTIEERFWPKVNKTKGCWLWTASTAAGYGTIGSEGGIKGRQLNAHRVSYELAYGKFAQSLYVLHRCDVKLCVNPEHLFLGTPQDNVDDMIAKGRQRSGHLYGKDHPNYGTKLPQWHKEALRKAHARPFKVIAPNGELIEGVNLREFCRYNELNQGAMSSVIAGRVRHHKGYTKFID